VLSVSATGSSIAEARERAYDAARIAFDGMRPDRHRGAAAGRAQMSERRRARRRVASPAELSVMQQRPRWRNEVRTSSA
jgi:hypothetical protein